MPPENNLATLFRAACSQSDPASREAAFAEILDLLLIYVRAGMGRALRNHRESADVCQSIARSLVEDVDAGRLHFETEPELRAYLRQVVRSRLAFLARSDSAQKRGGGARPTSLDPGGPEDSLKRDPPDPGASPSENVAADEARENAQATLSETALTVAQLRSRGMSWDEIAKLTGQSAEALRQEWSRLQRRMTDTANDSEK